MICMGEAMGHFSCEVTVISLVGKRRMWKHDDGSVMPWKLLTDNK